VLSVYFHFFHETVFFFLIDCWDTKGSSSQVLLLHIDSEKLFLVLAETLCINCIEIDLSIMKTTTTTTLLEKKEDHDGSTSIVKDKDSPSLSISPVSILPPAPNLAEGTPPLLNPWVIPASRKASRTTNPIREIVDPILANVSPRDDGKEFISLAVSQ
jgi:hypothetical protein